MAPPQFLRFNASRASSVTSFGFFVAVSVLTMIVDHKLQVMEPARSGFAFVASAVHNIAAYPAKGFADASEYLRHKSFLIEENEILKKRLAKSEMEQFRIQSLANENQALKEMLQQKAAFPVKTELFEIKRALYDGFTQRYQINGGSLDGIEVGMPVLTGSGLAGQIIHVAPYSSQVQLIQDKNQEVPVEFATSHARGIVRGTGDGEHLQSRDLPYSDKIAPGELVITSGLDGIYPKGIPVGTVKEVRAGEDGAYSEVFIETPKSIKTSEYVLVMFVDTKEDLWMEEAEPKEGEQIRRRPLR